MIAVTPPRNTKHEEDDDTQVKEATRTGEDIKLTEEESMMAKEDRRLTRRRTEGDNRPTEASSSICHLAAVISWRSSLYHVSMPDYSILVAGLFILDMCTNSTRRCGILYRNVPHDGREKERVTMAILYLLYYACSPLPHTLPEYFIITSSFSNL